MGYLLRKSPFRIHSFEQVFGKVHVFYPETTPECCTAALLLDIDPIGLVRNRRGPSGEGYTLEPYLNDRPNAPSSFLSVVIAHTFGTAITRKSKERQELADSPLQLEAQITVLPCRGGEGLLHRLFEPLGYQVLATRHALDEKFPKWGESPYYTVRLNGTFRLGGLLPHLYVLIPRELEFARISRWQHLLQPHAVFWFGQLGPIRAWLFSRSNRFLLGCGFSREQRETSPFVHWPMVRKLLDFLLHFGPVALAISWG